MDSDGRAICSAESGMTLLRVDDFQECWLNYSIFSNMDPGLYMDPLDVFINSAFSPLPQESACQDERSPTSLLNSLCPDETLTDSYQVASVVPPQPSMFLDPEHNSEEACLLQRYVERLECGPDVGEAHYLPLTASTVPTLYSYEEIQHQDHTPITVIPLTMTQEEVAGMGSPLPFSVQPCSSRMNSDQLAIGFVPEEAVKEQLYGQASLQDHDYLCCNQQLEMLKTHCQLGGVSVDSLDSIYPSIVPPQVGYEPHFSTMDSSIASSHLRESSLSSQVELIGQQEVLGSSSSVDVQEKDKSHRKTKTSPICSRVGQRRQERADLISSLQQRVFKLEEKMEEVVELLIQVCPKKDGVTNRQIKQTPLNLGSGLFGTASAADDDDENSSTASLLLNIEKQSAHVNEIISSLAPLSPLPLPKQPRKLKSKSALRSGHKTVESGCSKGKPQGTEGLLTANSSCAQTQPLVTHNKPKQFPLSTCNPGSLLDSEKFVSVVLSSPSSSEQCHKRKPSASHYKGISQSPTGVANSALSDRRANQSERKRSHTHCEKENCSDEGSVGKSNINNMVTHVSLPKLEKLQYKDILTASLPEDDTSPEKVKKNKERSGSSRGRMSSVKSSSAQPVTGKQKKIGRVAAAPKTLR